MLNLQIGKKKINQETMLLWSLSSVAVGCTFAITPGLNYDPINLIKASLLAFFAPLCLFLLLSGGIWRKTNSAILILVATFALSIIFPVFFTDAPLEQQLWGVWGRSTGLITYISLAVLLLSSTSLTNGNSRRFLLMLFLRSSYLMSFYVLIQFAELDPINWVQKAPVGTLGNINFMSGFLGLASILMAFELLDASNSLSQRLYFATFLVLNIFLIWESGSVQGIAILAAGVCVSIAFKIQRNASNSRGILFLTSSVLIGFFLLSGTAGIGPFKSIVQDSVLFRTDYWRAGLGMFIQHPFFGVGLDSYGDYYREFRDQLATNRTDAGRVANTAHNVFLDLFAGGGLLLGLSFTLLFACGLLLAIKNRRKSVADIEKMVALVVGYFVFCCISINQIGVAVWGFIFIGLLYAAIEEEVSVNPLDKSARTEKRNLKPHEGKFSKPNNQFRMQNLRTFFVILSLLFIGASIYLAPLSVDTKIFHSAKNGRLDQMVNLSKTKGAFVFHADKTVEKLIESGRLSEGVRHANWILKEKQPRDFYALTVVLKASTSIGERRTAALALQSIDPHNFGRFSIDEILSE